MAVSITMPQMHQGQLEVANDPARFKVLAAGRRWRKSSLGVLSCLDVALRGGIAWWVAPTYPMAAIGWRMLTRLAAQIPNTIKREVDKIIIMPSGGHVQIKSADKPDSLRGEGLDLAVLDECAFMVEPAWTEALRPALSDKKGKALFLSTPKGRNWFHKIWLRGQDPLEHDWQSWKFPTVSNPHIDPNEIENAKNSLPEQIFMQEYLADFIEDAGLVFRNISACAVAQPRVAMTHPLESYVFGVDWGKLNDFTVITVIDAEHRSMVYMDRFNQIDYEIQVKRLEALNDRFKPHAIVAERNSMGEPLIENLQRAGLPIIPFVTTNPSKTKAIDDLALAFETESIEILNDLVLIGELQAYEMERLPSGMLRYQAPEGMHDDCVMSLALAWSVVGPGGLQQTDVAKSAAPGGGDW